MKENAHLCAVLIYLIKRKHHVLGIFQRVVVGNEYFFGIGFLFVQVNGAHHRKYNNQYEQKPDAQSEFCFNFHL